MESKTYTISTLAKEHDVTPRAVRLYEELGLLAPLRHGSRRIYSERDRVRLRLVVRAKRIGLSLADTKELFDLYDANQASLTEKTAYTGNTKPLETLLAKLAERLALLRRQRDDIEMSILEIERVYNRALTSYNTIKLP